MGIFGFRKKKEDKKGKTGDKKDRKEDKKEIMRDVEPVCDVQEADVIKTDRKKADETADSKKSGDRSESLPSEKFSNIACKALIEPRVTEKSHDLMALNKYVFKVAKESDKNTIKKAIEELYGVKVIKVNIINIPSKKRIYARKVGWKSGYKKAIITLKKGDRIELFEGA